MAIELSSSSTLMFEGNGVTDKIHYRELGARKKWLLAKMGIVKKIQTHFYHTYNTPLEASDSCDYQ